MKKTTAVLVRLEDDLLAALDARASELFAERRVNVSRPEVIRSALRAHFKLDAPKRRGR